MLSIRFLRAALKSLLKVLNKKQDYAWLLLFAEDWMEHVKKRIVPRCALGAIRFLTPLLGAQDGHLGIAAASFLEIIV